MIIREFNSLEEIQKYYDERTDTYIFKEDGKWIDLVIFAFDLKVEANIHARDIKAYNIVVWNINALNIEAFEINASNIQCEDINAFNITALSINAGDIDANEIKARDISYWGVCFAYKNIICTSIKGRKENHKHFVLDGSIKILKNGELRERLEMNSVEAFEEIIKILNCYHKQVTKVDVENIGGYPIKKIKEDLEIVECFKKIPKQDLREFIEWQIRYEKNLNTWLEGCNCDLGKEEPTKHLIKIKEKLENEHAK